jgi:hypothetical protein
MSAGAASAVPPEALIFSTVCSQASAVMSSTPTAVPASASLVAVAAPIPRPAPVTMATLCASFNAFHLPSDTGRRRSGKAASGHDVLAGHPPRAWTGEERDDVRDVAGLTKSPQRGHGGRHVEGLP